MVIADISRGDIDIGAGFRRLVLNFIGKIGNGIVRLLIVVIAPDLDMVVDVHLLVGGKNDFASVPHRNPFLGEGKRGRKIVLGKRTT